MNGWSVLLVVVGYQVVALLAARAAYGVQRARVITREARWHERVGAGPTVGVPLGEGPLDDPAVDPADDPADDPVERFEDTDGASVATAAFLFGLAWPVTVPAYGLYWCARFVITANPPLTEVEREQRIAERGRRIRVLEEELEREVERGLKTLDRLED
ncbi:hypothetical protein ACTWP5_00160 [Streptomyces sp. 4N509B]|uniref:hypothetical protein n=1 Tax=Streptomyces sp. 4N509B TaxID=3457413 RepID=UPI003FD310CA